MSFTPRFWSTIASLIAGHFRFAKPPVAAAKNSSYVRSTEIWVLACLTPSGLAHLEFRRACFGKLEHPVRGIVKFQLTRFRA